MVASPPCFLKNILLLSFQQEVNPPSRSAPDSSRSATNRLTVKLFNIRALGVVADFLFRTVDRHLVLLLFRFENS
jgi:hypothetical protein